MSTPGTSVRLGAVILAGGYGVRLGGVDKAILELDGVTLLERALVATASADEVVVVGTRLPTSRAVTWTRESPAGGGPAAGLLAGLDAFSRPPQLVCALAVDMPRVTSSTVRRLVEALMRRADAEGAVLVDATGAQQPLAAVYRHAALMAARPARSEDEHGLAVRRLVASLELVTVPAVADEAHDVDTWDDLRSPPPEDSGRSSG